MWSPSQVGPGPVARPPPGLQTSTPSQSRVPALYAVSILTCLLAGTFIGTRLYVNIRFKLPCGRDFWTIFAAGIFCWAAGAMGIWGGTLGLGRHVGDIPAANHIRLTNVGIVLPTMSHVAALFVQCSILFFYLKRLTMSHSHRLTTYMIGAVSGLFCLVRIVANTYHCHPTPGALVGSCVKLHRMWYALGVINMVLGLTIWSLPIPPLWKSAGAGQMPRAIRIGVLATLGVGLLACIATAGNLVAFKAGVDHMEDISWHASLVYMFDQLEVGLGIVAACMPSLRRLVGIKSPSDDQPRQVSIDHEVLPGHEMLKGSAGDMKDMWLQDAIPPPPPRRFGGAIHFGPRGHLDLDIEGLGVLDSRLSGTMCEWRQQNIEMNDMSKGDVRSSTVEKYPPSGVDSKITSKNTSDGPAETKIQFDDGEITPDTRMFSFHRRGTGGSSLASQKSSPELEKYFPGSTSSKSPLRRSLSEEGLVPCRPNDRSRRDRSSDRDTSSR